MRCDEIYELMSEQIDGRLDSAGQKLLSEHLARCARCRADFAELQEAVKMVGGIGMEQPPPGLLSKIRGRIDEEKARSGLPARGTGEQASSGIRNLFLSPQARMALAASLLLAVGIYGFMSSLEKKEQGGDVTVSDEQPVAFQESRSAPAAEKALPPAAMSVTAQPPVTEKKKVDRIVTVQTGKGMPVEREEEVLPPAPAIVVPQKKMELQEQDRALSVAGAAARPEEVQDVHSRSVMLNRPAVMNQQNQVMETSVSREQAKAAFAGTAAQNQAGVISARSRQAPRVSGTLPDRQNMDSNVQGKVHELSIVTGDVEGVLSVLRKRLPGTGEGKAKKDASNEAQREDLAPAGSSGKTIIEIEIGLEEYSALIGELQAKGEVTAPGIAGQDAKSKERKDAFNAGFDSRPGAIVRLRVNIIRKE